MNCGRYTVAVFLYMEKTFDKVWHDGFLHKLLKTQLLPVLTKIIASFLRDRSFCVVVEEALSAHRPIRAEVPQGSCPSPSLFAAFTDDVSTLQGQLEEWEDDVILVLYADNNAYFASARPADLATKKIQRVFELLPEWLYKWRMAVNVGKTAALFTGRQRNMPTQSHLRGQDMEWKSCIRYLGVHIDRSLPMIPQVDHVIQQSRAVRAKLQPVLTSRLPTRTKIAIYNCYIRSRLTYAASACQGPASEIIEDFVRTQAHRLFDCADGDSISSLHNLVPQYERPPGPVGTPEKKPGSEPKTHARTCSRRRLQKTRRRPLRFNWSKLAHLIGRSLKDKSENSEKKIRMQLHAAFCPHLPAPFINRVGRRNMVMAIALVAGACGVVVNLVPHVVGGVVLLAVFKLGILVVGLYTAITVALFPTHLRAMAVALTMMAGRTGTFLSIQLINYLLVANCTLTFYLFCSLFMASALMASLLPDDRYLGKPQPPKESTD
ncbi:RNA-directed DNA polymerase from mobile element jockey [Eumeta japonica]|uniref:RNA-directed DNA polymerase from mobile element jockey n=1 Tax=Eumeta variegata TaxID=151549 RepID=A0A4C1U5M5_EUMVA|nr:RNA-directed DNA polymerase from mobile element jockey [Eumeta japonica]